MAIKVKKSSVTQTCFACPSQWDAETEDGRYVYVRYRWGTLRIEVAPNPESLSEEYQTVYREVLGDEYDGVISWYEVEEAAGLEMVDD